MSVNKALVMTFFHILVLILFIACSLPSSGGKIIVDSLDKPRETWTIIIHFAVDNDIDYEFERDGGVISNYVNTLEQIEAMDANDKVNIVMLMDCYNTDTQGENYVSTFEDGYYHLSGGNFSDDIVVSMAEVNSGSLGVTQAFFDWAIENYPADGYIYSIFNHGGGFDDYDINGTYGARGIAFDDSNGDCLSHNELGQATSYLKSLIGHNIDLFYPYACYMGGVELAYEVRNNADYLLFSESFFSVGYWSYEALDIIVSNDDAVSAIDIGKAFCDSAYNYFTIPAHEAPFILSFICLSKVESLVETMDLYAANAMIDINDNSNHSSYFAAAGQAMKKGAVWTYYMDLGCYLDVIVNSSFIDDSVKNVAVALYEKLSECIIYVKEYYWYSNNAGMSIFHNYAYDTDETFPVDIYKNILTFGSTLWADYIELMDSLGLPAVVSDGYEDDNDFTTANNITVGGETQDHTLHTTSDEDYLVVHFEAGISYKIETYYNSMCTDTILYLYDVNGIEVAYNDDANNDLYSMITYNCTSSGIYYIRVDKWGSAIGDYSIDVHVSE